MIIDTQTNVNIDSSAALVQPPKNLRTYQELREISANAYEHKIGKLYAFGETVAAIYMGKLEDGSDLFITTTNLLQQQRSLYNEQLSFPQNTKNFNQWVPITPNIANWCVQQFKRHPDKYHVARANKLIIGEPLWTNEEVVRSDGKRYVRTVNLSASTQDSSNWLSFIDCDDTSRKLFGCYSFIKKPIDAWVPRIGDRYYLNDSGITAWYLGQMIQQNTTRFGSHILGFMPPLEEDEAGNPIIGFDPLSNIIEKPYRFSLPPYYLMRNIGLNIGEFKYTNYKFAQLANADFWNGGNRIFWTSTLASVSSPVSKCYDSVNRSFIMAYISQAARLRYNVMYTRLIQNIDFKQLKKAE